MNNCVFCKIINKEYSSYTIYEDDKVKVFLSIDPISNGHTLVIPKKHILDFKEIDLETLNHIMKISKNIYNLLEEKLIPNGIKLVQNNGSIQEVKHFHLHLIPMFDEKQELLPLDEVLNRIIK